MTSKSYLHAPEEVERPVVFTTSILNTLDTDQPVVSDHKQAWILVGDDTQRQWFLAQLDPVRRNTSNKLHILRLS